MAVDFNHRVGYISIVVKWTHYCNRKLGRYQLRQCSQLYQHFRVQFHMILRNRCKTEVTRRDHGRAVEIVVLVRRTIGLTISERFANYHDDIVEFTSAIG